MMSDISVENHGSLCLVRLRTDAARDWVDEFVQDDAMFLGGALVVEPRFVEDLLSGMLDAGLEME